MSEGINLFEVFSAVTGALQDNKRNLNKADSYNQNHGDNMVQIFELITKATQEKKDEKPARQLDYAADLVNKATQSGSAQVYVQGLQNAAKEFTGSNISLESIVPLIQMLLGGGKSSSGTGGDLLGSLLGGLGGVDADDDGLDMGDLLNAGLSFMNAKDDGDSNLEALAEVLVSNTAIGQSDSSHRAQSGQVVAKTVMQLLANLGK